MYVDIKLLGPPSNKVISVLTLDRRDGNIVDGRVEFSIQKGQDANSRQILGNPIDGNVLVAEVRNGQEWQSPAMDLRPLINAGFDTLVVRHPDGELLRWLTPPPNVSQSQQNASGQQRQQQRQPKIVIELAGFTLYKKNDGKAYDMEVAGKITQDGQPKADLSLDLYYDGGYDTLCQLSPGVKTDNNGRFVHTFKDKPAVGKQVKWEVQIRGGASRLFYADIPAAPAEKPKEPAPKPTTLKAVLLASFPVGNKMRHSISLQTLDQKGNPVNGGVCAWVVGPVSAQTGREDLVKRTIIDVDVEGDTEFNSVLMDHDIIQEKPLKLSGPPKPEKKQEEPATLEVVPLSIYPQSDGKWRVRVITKVGDKLASRLFSLVSNELIEMRRTDQSTGQTGYGFNSLECPAGIAEFVISAAVNIRTIRLSFCLQGDNKPCEVVLRRNMW